MAPAPKPYFLLSEVATRDKVNKLLGRAVPFESAKPNDDDNPLKRPSEGRIYPILPPEGPDLRELDKYLYPREVRAKDASTLLKGAQGSDARLAISKALALFHSTETSNTREASIPVFRRLTIDEGPRRIEELLKHPEYSAPIIKYFTDFPDGKLGIINSIICVMDMSLNVQHSQSRETGAEFEVPSEALGVPHKTADVGAELSAFKAKLSEAGGTYEGEVVVACSYLQMTRKRQPRSWLMSLFRPNKPSRDDINITNESVQPSTMTVSLPSRRIPGNHEAFLGGIGDASDEGLKVVDDVSDSDSDGDEILLYV